MRYKNNTWGATNLRSKNSSCRCAQNSQDKIWSWKVKDYQSKKKKKKWRTKNVTSYPMIKQSTHKGKGVTKSTIAIIRYLIWALTNWYLQIRGKYDTKLALTNNTSLFINTLLNSFSIFQHHHPRRKPTFMWHVDKQKFIDDTTIKLDFVKPGEDFKAGLCPRTKQEN